MTTDPGLIPPPTHCKCGQPVSVVRIKVRHIEPGRFRVGAFSEFGEVTRTRRRILNDGFQYVAWLADCAECFGRQDDQAGLFSEQT